MNQTKMMQPEQEGKKLFVFSDAIDINLLDNDKWDSREHNENTLEKEEKHIRELAADINQNGLINPITIAPSSKKKGRYSIIAGRFRVAACRKLAWVSIPARIIINENDENKLNNISYSENEKRLGYSVDEQNAKILRPFEVAGFTHKDIIYYAKKLHNFGTKGIPEEFLIAMEQCGKAPNTLYNIMQTYLQLDPKVIKACKNANLHTDKRCLLTNRRLRKHPKVAIDLIKKIHGMSLKQASYEVRQAIRDLETKAIVKIQGEYFFDYSKRDKIGKVTDELFEKTNLQHYLELIQLTERILFHSTGYTLTQQNHYEPQNIDYTENHRINILKTITPVQFHKFREDLEVLRDAIHSWLDLMEDQQQPKEEGELTR